MDCVGVGSSLRALETTHPMEVCLGLSLSSKVRNIPIQPGCTVESDAASCLSSTMVHHNELEDSGSSLVRTSFPESAPVGVHELDLFMSSGNSVPVVNNRVALPDEIVLAPSLGVTDEEASCSLGEAGRPMKKMRQAAFRLGLDIDDKIVGTEQLHLGQPLMQAVDGVTGAIMPGLSTVPSSYLEKAPLESLRKLNTEVKSSSPWWLSPSMVSGPQILQVQNESQWPADAALSLEGKQGSPQILLGPSLPFQRVKQEANSKEMADKLSGARGFCMLPSETMHESELQSFIAGKESPRAASISESTYSRKSRIPHCKIDENMPVTRRFQSCPENDAKSFVQWQPLVLETQHQSLSKEILFGNHQKLHHAARECTNPGSLPRRNYSVSEGSQLQGSSLGLIFNPILGYSVPLGAGSSNVPQKLPSISPDVVHQSQIGQQTPDMFGKAFTGVTGPLYFPTLQSNDDGNHGPQDASKLSSNDNGVPVGAQHCGNLSVSLGSIDYRSTTQHNLQLKYNLSLPGQSHIPMPLLSTAPNAFTSSLDSQNKTGLSAGDAIAVLELPTGLALCQRPMDVEVSGLDSEVPSCVSVLLDGSSIIGRICLQKYDGYESFAIAIRRMYQSNTSEGPLSLDEDCSLSDAIPMHMIAYEDAEGDVLLAGDLSWRDFVRAVKQIRIIPSKVSKVKDND